ncbi:hypothetical protein [Pedobacter xixiisoli]|uniref:Uncharacterized protein n=1 Tax=Pedobacter xixiisoli TaxID=1476464 RepID=A0A286ADS3_9SPHI|nr:hypothetical protein [Pedobacter xixiisoli]SOD20045.1 hypothetical protein SAMN06297358_3754 [Pedobacter xixiisoli]
MKKIILSFFILVGMVSACRKSDNAKLPDLQAVPQPQLTRDASADMSISAQTPDAFNGKINVGLYFPDDIKPAKMDLVVIKNDNKANVKVVKTDITTYPTLVAITGAQLKALFGNTVIVLGDKFDFGVNITTADGKVYPAFTTTGISVGSGITALPNARPTVRYEAMCKFTATDYGAIGVATNYVVVKDEWEDYAPGDVVPIKVIDATHISFEYPLPIQNHPVIVEINPTTNETKVVKQEVGTYNMATYGIFSVESVASADNYVAPCELTLSVKLKWTAAAGTYSNGAIIKLKKQ